VLKAFSMNNLEIAGVVHVSVGFFVSCVIEVEHLFNPDETTCLTGFFSVSQRLSFNLYEIV